MTVKGGTSQACAACKYQRTKCSDQCPLAPYFPASNPKTFQNAHRLFGVSNMMKILKQVKEEHKHDAMQSIIYESDMRARFPLHGCCGIIRELHSRVQDTLQELAMVKQNLNISRQLHSRVQDTLQELAMVKQNLNISRQLHGQSPSTSRPSQPPQPLQRHQYSSSSSPSPHWHQPITGGDAAIPGCSYQFDQHCPASGPPAMASNQLLAKEKKGKHVGINKQPEASMSSEPDFDNDIDNFQHRFFSSLQFLSDGLDETWNGASAVGFTPNSTTELQNAAATFNLPFQQNQLIETKKKTERSHC